MDEGYKSPASAKAAARAKLRRDAIKAAGGEKYAALLEKERLARRAWRAVNRHKIREYERKYDSYGQPYKTYLCSRARKRGRQNDLPATIKPTDLIWPSHCPVLGIELDYPERSGQRKDLSAKPNWPSLDRWDPEKGYVPGNVFVISFRANTLKNNVSRDEILQIAKYVMSKPRPRQVEKDADQCVVELA